MRGMLTFVYLGEGRVIRPIPLDLTSRIRLIEQTAQIQQMTARLVQEVLGMGINGPMGEPKHPVNVGLDSPECPGVAAPSSIGSFHITPAAVEAVNRFTGGRP